MKKIHFNPKKNYFLRCAFGNSAYFMLALLLSYVLADIMVRGNRLIGQAIDGMLAGEAVKFGDFIVLFLGLTLIGTAVAFVKSIANSKFSLKVQTRYKNLVAQKLYRLEYKYFDENGSAAVINKMNSDIAEAELLLGETLPEICTNIVELFTYAFYVGRLNSKLLFLMLLCYPIVLCFTNYVARKLTNLKKVFRQKSDSITEIAHDCVNGILALRTFGAEEHFQKKLDEAAQALVDNEEKRTRISNTAIIIRKFLQWIPNIICAVYAYFLVLHNALSIGELMAFILILERFVQAFIGLPFGMVDMKEHLVCIKRVEKILNEPDEAGTAPLEPLPAPLKRRKSERLWFERLLSERSQPESLQPESLQPERLWSRKQDYNTGLQGDTDEKTAVSFEKVSFAYTEKEPVLKGVSFLVPAGSNVAFVGESGGGKSTIFRILCGFYPIGAGEYKLFGKNFREWNIEAARDTMALVSQNVFLFPATIYENVRYGNLNASREEIITACRNARIHDFIAALPEGYDTEVGERGILLSGGERQRISIARAFLKNAPILLLDEPTSAVDVETERLIQEAIESLSQNRTCITIAHRLSTIQKADKIMVLKDGVIVEEGTHGELLKKQGAYSGMYGREAAL